jgi:hypothetical protein
MFTGLLRKACLLQYNQNKKMLCIQKSASHQQKETQMNLPLPSLAPELMMPQPPVHQHQKPHQSSPPHCLPILAAQASEELPLLQLGQHLQARRKRPLPSVEKAPMSKSPGVISIMSSSMMYKGRNLQATEIVGTSSDKFYSVVESKATISNLMIYPQAIKM